MSKRRTEQEMDDAVSGVKGELVGGPQDGAKVHSVGGNLPQTVYVGQCWLGDGYAAWSREKCDRFPCCYILDGYVYKFRPRA